MSGLESDDVGISSEDEISKSSDDEPGVFVEDRDFTYAIDTRKVSSTMQSIDFMPLYPHTGNEATARGDYVHNIAKDMDNDLTMNERLELTAEADDMYKYAAWKRGYSDISRYPSWFEDQIETSIPPKGLKKTEDYFLCIVPGGNTYKDDDALIRDKIRTRKRDVEDDLVTYYRYSQRMFNKKLAILQSMMRLVSSLTLSFAKYEKGAVLAAMIEDSNGKKYLGTNGVKQVTVSREDITIINNTINSFLNEILYIHAARKIKSYYGARFVLNFAGQHTRVVLTRKALDWISEDPALTNFRNYLSDDEGAFFRTWAGSGRLTIKTLNIVIRIALLGRGVHYKDANNRTFVKYRPTKHMTRKLGVVDEIPNLRVRSFAKTLVTVPHTEVDKRFVSSEYTHEGFSQFVEESKLIQEYSDLAVQPILKERARVMTVKRKNDAVVKAARKRLAATQKRQLEAIKQRKADKIAR